MNEWIVYCNKGFISLINEWMLIVKEKPIKGHEWSKPYTNNDKDANKSM